VGADGYTIGEVLNQLKEEFEDITISKIRFLESEGLVYPDRTESGYRKFTDDDIDRLRFILTAQRDHYLPLKVIREQLEKVDAGEAPTRGPAPPPPVSGEESARQVRLRARAFVRSFMTTSSTCIRSLCLFLRILARTTNLLWMNLLELVGSIRAPAIPRSSRLKQRRLRCSSRRITLVVAAT
jgi:DNA-binding transcriptional MerR regulator